MCQLRRLVASCLTTCLNSSLHSVRGGGNRTAAGATADFGTRCTRGCWVRSAIFLAALLLLLLLLHQRLLL